MYLFRSFEAYLEENGKTVDYASVTISDLCDTLCGFYADLHPQKGRHYKVNSMKNVRAALSRHFQEKRLDLGIIKRPEFKHANQVLDSVPNLLQRMGTTDGLFCQCGVNH